VTRSLILTEIPEEVAKNLPENNIKLSKCDGLIFLYENDQDQMDFIKEMIGAFREHQRFLP